MFSCAHADNAEAKRGIWEGSPSVSSLKSERNVVIPERSQLHNEEKNKENNNGITVVIL